ncbi:MAG: substrate-binding domain-containing protein [Halofilum sp. (in: g-proteobacteria)]|nr:substrate-binding domain-containing protein [Halofilum sp. (in: g-proteobacteria)]
MQAVTRTLARVFGGAFITAAVLLALPVHADDRYITVASTTSTEASGLFGHILPAFEEETGIDVRVVAVGTGQAIEIARRGDADVLFVHHKPSEEEFIANGHGVKRHPVMYNDFIIVGPGADPAGIEGMNQRPRGVRDDRRGRGPVHLARRRLGDPQKGTRDLG